MCPCYTHGRLPHLEFVHRSCWVRCFASLSSVSLCSRVLRFLLLNLSAVFPSTATYFIHHLFCFNSGPVNVISFLNNSILPPTFPHFASVFCTLFLLLHNSTSLLSPLPSVSPITDPIKDGEGHSRGRVTRCVRRQRHEREDRLSSLTLSRCSGWKSKRVRTTATNLPGRSL